MILIVNIPHKVEINIKQFDIVNLLSNERETESYKCMFTFHTIESVINKIP